MIKKFENLSVGEAYQKDKINYPCQENIKFNFNNSCGTVTIFYNRPALLKKN